MEEHQRSGILETSLSCWCPWVQEGDSEDDSVTSSLASPGDLQSDESESDSDSEEEDLKETKAAKCKSFFAPEGRMVFS